MYVRTDMKATAVYYRHFLKRSEEFDSLQDAIAYLEDGGDRNELYAIAVIWEGRVIKQTSIETQEQVEAQCKEYMNG